jgi:hypothetical protein
MAYRPIEPVGLGRNVAAEMAKGAPRLQQEMNTMGPDTIKMIALQQIAEQEKQRANNANLQAQPNPMTVLQQVEQEVMQMRQPQQPTDGAAEYASCCPTSATPSSTSSYGRANDSTRTEYTSTVL